MRVDPVLPVQSIAAPFAALMKTSMSYISETRRFSTMDLESPTIFYFESDNGEADEQRSIDDSHDNYHSEACYALEEVYALAFNPDMIADHETTLPLSITKICNDASDILTYDQRIFLACIRRQFKTDLTVDAHGEVHKFAYGDQSDRDKVEILDRYQKITHRSLTSLEFGLVSLVIYTMWHQNKGIYRPK